MPYAGDFVHGDTAQQLDTALQLQNGHFVINSKKTFLTPLLYSLSAEARIPVAYFVAVFQHLFGVLLVVGLLTQALFALWRLWIVPLTVLIAINPNLLWYEHTLLPESLTVFGAVAVALAGTVFFRRPNRFSLTILFLAVLFVASARPEGHFFALFALALVIRRFWGEWSRLKIYSAVSAAFMLLIFLATPTSQSGVLLYASLVQWSPAHLAVAPGLAETMQPFQARAMQQWKIYSFQYTRLRKDMYNSVVEHLKREGLSKAAAEQQVNGFFQRAGIEIAIRNFWRLPGLAVQKFFIAHRETLAMGFKDYAIRGQLRALYRVNGGREALGYSRLLWGVPMATMDDARPFLQANYDLSAGEKLTKFLNSFAKGELYPAVLIEIPGSTLTGLPWLYVCGLIGGICLIVRDRPIIGLHLIWFLFLCTLFVIVMVTGNFRARYRIVFEPFWFIYLFGLLDSGMALVHSASRRVEG